MRPCESQETSLKAWGERAIPAQRRRTPWLPGARLWTIEDLLPSGFGPVWSCLSQPEPESDQRRVETLRCANRNGHRPLQWNVHHPPLPHPSLKPGSTCSYSRQNGLFPTSLKTMRRRDPYDPFGPRNHPDLSLRSPETCSEICSRIGCHPPCDCRLSPPLHEPSGEPTKNVSECRWSWKEKLFEPTEDSRP